VGDGPVGGGRPEAPCHLLLRRGVGEERAAQAQPRARGGAPVSARYVVRGAEAGEPDGGGAGDGGGWARSVKPAAARSGGRVMGWLRNSWVRHHIQKEWGIDQGNVIGKDHENFAVPEPASTGPSK
jgi:hypothetical protein